MKVFGRFSSLIMIAWILDLLGCSTSEISPKEMPLPPVYTKVPHPQGMDLADLSNILKDDTAPKEASFYKECDKDFQKLKSLTRSKAEMEEGIKELIKQDPVSYHWCFYGKLNQLESDAKNDSYLDQKQKIVLSAYEFLVPIARAFLSEFHDSRYLRWAVFRYQKMSEVVFFRRLEITPAGTVDLVQPVNQFGLWRRNEETLVLEKYHLNKNKNPDSKVLPSPGVSPSTSASNSASNRVGVDSNTLSPQSPVGLNSNQVPALAAAPIALAEIPHAQSDLNRIPQSITPNGLPSPIPQATPTPVVSVLPGNVQSTPTPVASSNSEKADASQLKSSTLPPSVLPTSQVGVPVPSYKPDTKATPKPTPSETPSSESEAENLIPIPGV